MSDSRISVASLLSADTETSNVYSNRAHNSKSVIATAVDEHDEDVMIAVRALGNMRHRAMAPPPLQLSTSSSYGATPSLSTSTSTAPSTIAESKTPFIFGEDRHADFVSRVAEIPLVTSALRAYEHGKASSRVVKFGVEMVESSVITMTKPMLDRLPVDQLDEFACRQLDRFSSHFKSSTSFNTGHTMDGSGPSRNNIGRLQEESAARSSLRDDNGSSMETVNENSSPPKWQSVLFEASGIGVAVSTESMRRLKYCLHWLQYATSRIDNQIITLQHCIASHSLQTSSPSTEQLSSHSGQIHQIKNDLIFTIRQVVEIISKYAGGALPEPARTTVRGFILTLPQRLVSATAGGASVGEAPVSSPTSSDRKSNRRPRGSRNSSQSSSHHKPFSAQTPDSVPLSPTSPGSNMAAQKILTLATESLDMLRNVTNVFTQSLEKAEAWVERLRVVGVDKQGEQDTSPIEGLSSETAARGNSTSSSPPPETPADFGYSPVSRINESSDKAISDSEDEAARPKKTLRMDPHR